VWEVAGVRVSLFDLLEFPQEVLNDEWAEVFSLARFHDVIYGTITVLELGVAHMGW
jgi:hypothetical protein